MVVSDFSNSECETKESIKTEASFGIGVKNVRGKN